MFHTCTCVHGLESADAAFLVHTLFPNSCPFPCLSQLLSSLFRAVLAAAWAGRSMGRQPWVWLCCGALTVVFCELSPALKKQIERTGYENEPLGVLRFVGWLSPAVPRTW